jgi:hypothetical protein
MGGTDDPLGSIGGVGTKNFVVGKAEMWSGFGPLCGKLGALGCGLDT